MKAVFIIFLSCILLCQISCKDSLTIKGKVFDIHNNPLPNVEIRFIAYKMDKQCPSGGVKSVSTTNENGEFEVPIEKAQKDEKLGLVIVKDEYKIETIKFTIEEMKKFDKVFKNYNIHLEKNE